MNFENYENVDMERLVNDENYEIERTSTFGRVLRVVRKKPEEEGEIDTSNIGPSRLIEAFEKVGKTGGSNTVQDHTFCTVFDQAGLSRTVCDELSRFSQQEAPNAAVA